MNGITIISIIGIVATIVGILMAYYIYCQNKKDSDKKFRKVSNYLKLSFITKILTLIIVGIGIFKLSRIIKIFKRNSKN